jgi:hypothetical protein
VPEPSASDSEVGIGKLNRYRSSGVNQIQVGGQALHSEIHVLI